MTFIDDSMGLHKIGNPCVDAGAVTLHLYTPPFRSCKVWLQDNLKYGDSTEVSIGFFSVFGVRTPHLEGTQSMLHRVTAELLEKKKKSIDSA